MAALQGYIFAAGTMFSLAHVFRVMCADRGYWCLPEADINLPFTPGMDRDRPGAREQGRRHPRHHQGVDLRPRLSTLPCAAGPLG